MGNTSQGAQQLSMQQFQQEQRMIQERIDRERRAVQEKIDVQNQFSASHGRNAPSYTGYDQGRSFENPAGSIGPFPTRNGSGMMYIGGSGGNSLHKNVYGVRHMSPTDHNHGHSVTYFNSHNQTVHPQTGRTIAKSDPNWHINPFF